MSLIIKSGQLPTQPVDLGDLSSCIQHCANLMQQTGATIAEIRPYVTRLFSEGLDGKTVLAMLSERKDELHEMKVLGHGTGNLSVSDFIAIEKRIEINDPTPKNRAIWEARFKSGAAAHLCPRCGFSGNSEFLPPKGGSFSGFPDSAHCPLCHIFDDTRYFTRSWSDAERQTFETERANKRLADEAERLEQAALQKRNKEFFATLRVPAETAARLIDLFQWDLAGEDPEDYFWNDATGEDFIKRLVRLMARPTERGSLPLTVETVVTFFKENLKSPEDTFLFQEFVKCAKQLDQTFGNFIGGKMNQEILYQTLNLLLGDIQQRRNELANGPLEVDDTLIGTLMAVRDIAGSLATLDIKRKMALYTLRLECAKEISRLRPTALAATGGQ